MIAIHSILLFIVAPLTIAFIIALCRSANRGDRKKHLALTVLNPGLFILILACLFVDHWKGGGK